MIDLQVTRSIYYPRDFRGTRDPGPEPYDGASDIDEFEKWLVQLLKFYQTNKMCGRRADFLRVIHVGKHLSGEASDWYESTVYSIDRDPGVQWTFIEVVRHLFWTFIDESTLQLAVQSYYRVKYSDSKGVYSYIRELKKKANRLTSKPDEFTFRERFIDGLPVKLVDRMIDRYDITAESSTIDQMTAAIRKIEKSSAYQKCVRERRTHNSTGSRSPSPRRRDRHDRPDRDRPRRRSRSREKSWNKRREWRLEKQDRHRPNREDPRRERTFRERDHERERERERGGRKGKGPNPNVICFACRQTGHYANDPSCPMYGKQDRQTGPALRDRPQVRAARAGKEEEQDPGLEMETYLGDGSQYSSSADESTSSESDSRTSTSEEATDGTSASRGRPQLNRLEAKVSDGNEDVKYIRVVRAKVTPAVENPARSSMNRKLDRPKRSKGEETCLAGWIRINGVDALTLFDSGSNTDRLSPSFTQVSKIPTRKLEHQIPLQLGTVGSRAAINYGAEVPIEVGDVQNPDYYFDIVNIDRYDCIAGAPLMRQFGIRLDFKEDAIYIGEQRISALLPDEEAAILRGRQPSRPRRK
jgi:hypothetical protein